MLAAARSVSGGTGGGAVELAGRLGGVPQGGEADMVRGASVCVTDVTAECAACCSLGSLTLPHHADPGTIQYRLELSH